MADLTKTVAIIFDATDLTSESVAKINQGLRSMAVDAGDAGNSAQQAGESIQNIGDNEEGILSVANAVKALAASFVVQSFLDANNQFESLQRTLLAVTGDAALAADEFKYIQGIANNLGVDVFDLGSAFTKFAAATKGSALEGDAAKYIFEGFGGALAAVGSSTADITGAMTQLAQGVSKGKFELEDLKSIAERLPGFFPLMADAMGVTTEALFDMVSQGEITGETMLKVAEELKERYGDVAYVDTFAASWQRVKNALGEFAVEAGQSGTMDQLSDSMTVLAEAIKAVSGYLDEAEVNAKETTTAIQLMGGGGIFGALSEYAIQFAAGLIKSKDSAEEVTTSLEEAGKTGEEAGGKIADGAASGEASLKALDDATKATNKAMKELGLDPDKVGDQTQKILDAFDALSNSAASTGEQILAGLLVSIDQVSDDALPELAADLDAAFSSGKISADEYAAGVNALEQALGGMWPEAAKSTKEIKDQEKALLDAEKAAFAATKEANDYAIAMAKIEGDLQGKVIEATAKLNIANVEADAKKFTSIMDNLSKNYQVATTTIGEILGTITDNANTAADKIKIDAVNAISKQAQEAHDLEMKMVQGQIAYYAEKTKALSSGQPLISVQADGLQPHLEAFMWEILSQIQAKMAYDGADMLVGGCSL